MFHIVSYDRKWTRHLEYKKKNYFHTMEQSLPNFYQKIICEGIHEDFQKASQKAFPKASSKAPQRLPKG